MRRRGSGRGRRGARRPPAAVRRRSGRRATGPSSGPATRSRLSGSCIHTKRTGRVWCGAGAVSASATAASTSSGATGSSLNRRTDRRSSCAWPRPSASASSVPSQNRSSSPGRSSVRALDPSSDSVSPRTTATGISVSLPLTRSAAAAISSATAISVTISSLPCRSCDARVAVQHGQAGGADREVGLAVAPGPAHGVGDDHADRDPEPLAQPGPQRRGAGVGVDGQQRELTGVDVGAVDSRGGLHQAERVLGDQRAALAGEHPHGFGIDQLAPQRVPLFRVGRGGDDAALALGHHLAGDHHDVVVAQPRCGLGDAPRRGRRPAGTREAPAPGSISTRRG